VGSELHEGEGAGVGMDVEDGDGFVAAIADVEEVAIG